MTNTETYIQKLLESNPLREPVLKQVIETLQLPHGSCGLDAGCGIGRQAQLLAQAVGPTGKVTGLDLSPELVLYANKRLRTSDLMQQVTFTTGDLTQLPFEANRFDWVWSADCAGYPVGDLPAILREMQRVVKPGGTIALLAWSSQQLLPGYPLLEARLNANGLAHAAVIDNKPPDSHFLRALKWFREAGLENCQGKTFVGQVQAPLSREIEIALVSLFDMLWGKPLPTLSPEDWHDYRQLCDPRSSDFILKLPEYYAFFTYTLFWGSVIGYR